MNKVDFLMAGVGGQGTILGSDVLAEAGLALGYDVKNLRGPVCPSGVGR